MTAIRTATARVRRDNNTAIRNEQRRGTKKSGKTTQQQYEFVWCIVFIRNKGQLIVTVTTSTTTTTTAITTATVDVA